MITLQFSTTNHLSSKAIRFFTWSWASHVEFVLPDNKFLGALATHNGVVEHDLIEYTRIERYTVDAPESIIDIARTQIGRPYDWGGVMNFIPRQRIWTEDDKWFCSELVAWAFEQGGYPLLRADGAYRITPRDILLSPLLKPIV